MTYEEILGLTPFMSKVTYMAYRKDADAMLERAVTYEAEGRERPANAALRSAASIDADAMQIKMYWSDTWNKSDLF